MRHTINFILDVAEFSIKNPNDEFHAALFDKRNSPRQKGGTVGPKDIMRILDSNGSTVTSIVVKKLLNDILTYFELAETDLKVKWMAGKLVPKIEEL